MGVLWLLVQFEHSTRAELRAFSLHSGLGRSVWQLPSGHRWASGLCRREQSSGLVAASNDLSDVAARPVLWRLDVERSRGASVMPDHVSSTFLPRSFSRHTQL